MAEELSYVLVTPHSIRKSRTGGILARLISRTGLDLAAARMFAPGAELVAKYGDSLVTDPEPTHRATQEQIRKYVLAQLTPQDGGPKPRVLLLVFKGEDAVSKVARPQRELLVEDEHGGPGGALVDREDEARHVLLHLAGVDHLQ